MRTDASLDATGVKSNDDAEYVFDTGTLPPEYAALFGMVKTSAPRGSSPMYSFAVMTIWSAVMAMRVKSIITSRFDDAAMRKRRHAPAGSPFAETAKSSTP